MSTQDELEQQLGAVFSPHYLQVKNESHLHGAAPRDPGKIRESHFKVVLVSDQFVGKRLIQQHQQVYGALGEIMPQIHALALHTYTPEEWTARQTQAPTSPQCPKSG